MAFPATEETNTEVHRGAQTMTPGSLTHTLPKHVRLYDIQFVQSGKTRILLLRLIHTRTHTHTDTDRVSPPSFKSQDTLVTGLMLNTG